ncbi:MAG: lipoyl protein ligase domain-containing protein [Prochlorotrichaceae cyanobacterium]
MSLKPGRLLPLMVNSGNLQMAIDEWLLSHYNPEQWSMVLRFYHWQPAALSLGYGQRRWPDHWQTLTWQDRPLPLIRRPTGGRGVLHHGDLCYALVTAPLPKGKPNRPETYCNLCRFLQQGWESLGFPLRYGNDRPGRLAQQQTANCFALKTSADLQLSNGCKWIGSAQRWRSGNPEVVLQHGSMRLSPDPELWQLVFGSPLSPLPEEIVVPSPETIVSTLIEAASDCFQIPWILEPLSDQEWNSIHRLVQSRLEAEASPHDTKIHYR